MSSKASSSKSIEVQGLSKSYRISSGVDTRSAAEAIVLGFKSPFQRSKNTTFNALSDVSFDVKQGEAVGVIGHNGAGKSTLLKVLTRITRPTTGQVIMHGRVGSLLEVGTGFHSELTGRENIHLNGAILGMRPAEIKGAFDDIVEFAGVSAFLDTPVKRYSSGMTVRLAFSVAAHLRCDVLLVDEVLAVGDANFQSRSRDKMSSLTHDGRTVLLVSHSMEYVNSLCERTIVMDQGRISFDGPVREGTQKYLEVLRNGSSQSEAMAVRRPGTGEMRFVNVKPRKPGFTAAEPKVIDFEVEQFAPYEGEYIISFHIIDDSGQPVAHCDSRVLGKSFTAHSRLQGMFSLKTPWLKPGSYYINAFLARPRVAVVDEAVRVGEFHVDPVLPYAESHDAELYSGAPVLSDFDFV